MNYNIDLNHMDDFLDELNEREFLQAVIIKAMEENDFEAAARMLEQYQEEHGMDEFYHMARIDTAEGLDNPEEMLSLIELAEETLGPSSLLELRKARYFFYVTDYQQALEHAEKAQFDEQSESFLTVQHIKGFTYVLLGRLKEALEAFEDILMEIYDPRIGLICGLIYKELGKPERAREYVEKAMSSDLSRSPDLADIVAALDGSPDKALENSQTVLKALTNSEVPEEEDLSIQRQQMEEFVEKMAADPQMAAYYKSLISKSPHTADKEFLMLVLARVYFKTGEHAKSRKMYRDLVLSPIVPDEDGCHVVSLLGHIAALGSGGYTRKWVVKYLKDWSVQLKGENSSQLAIMEEARDYGFEDVFAFAKARLNRKTKTDREQMGIFFADYIDAVLDCRFDEAADLFYSDREWALPHEEVHQLLLAALTLDMELVNHLEPAELRPALIVLIRYCACLLDDQFGTAASTLVEFVRNHSGQEADVLLQILDDEEDFEPFECLWTFLRYQIRFIPLL